MSNPTLTTADPRTLTPNPWNTNIVGPDNEAKIDASIKRLGMFKPIVVRTLASGELQILGGEHRNGSAIRLGMTEVPIVNLGQISDKKAKEIGLVDNGRYGSDDTLLLTKLLEEIGTPAELGAFLPYSDSEFESIFASSTIALDDLDFPDEGTPTPSPSTTAAPQTHVIMRFKVPVGDSATITDAIERTMKRQRFTDEDSLTNAGHALVHIIGNLA
ncbi:ParB/RepB/Spo0J family partition protein [Duganella sp. FT27W]|uniref:ParB/RepB/Spo0J family partition protein n=1 Tax=Duganella sp. FT27W TaxID=2654636 RepID=UPI00128C31E4|nr:ParB/RepB/Spo0J family partition protein [Duganella sp. FT27W]MPQ56285.1 chromosome partitioning protein ParB [Duganella sp. FT27W]